jgi:hypothetical protein
MQKAHCKGAAPNKCDRPGPLTPQLLEAPVCGCMQRHHYVMQKLVHPGIHARAPFCSTKHCQNTKPNPKPMDNLVDMHKIGWVPCVFEGPARHECAIPAIPRPNGNQPRGNPLQKHQTMNTNDAQCTCATCFATRVIKNRLFL